MKPTRLSFALQSTRVPGLRGGSPKARTGWRRRILVMLSLGVLLVWTPTALARSPGATAKPKLGGNIMVRVGSAPDCLDPYKTTEAQVSQINYPVIDTLLSLSDKGKIVPYLAQKYTVGKGGRSITFFLRHDVRFSNGDPFTAQAVKDDFQRAVDPATKSPISKGFLSMVSSITTSGKYIVRLNLSAPNRPLLTNLAGGFLGIMDPKSVAAAGSNTCGGLVGSGPFRIANVGSDQTVTETRNPLHTFGPSWAHNKGPAYVKSLTFVPVADDTTAASELLSGQLDITNVAGTELSRVQGNSGIKLYRVLSQGMYYLEFNSGRSPFNNMAVRRAVAQAIDRKALITAGLQGLGKVATSAVPPGAFGYDPGSAKYALQLNRNAARAAIAAAGATGPYTMLTCSCHGLDAAAEVAQAELAQVGMQVTIDVEPLSGWLDKLNKDDFDLSFAGYYYNDADVLYLFFDSSQRNGGLDSTGMTDPKLDALLQAGRTNLNLKKAKAAYIEAQKLINTKAYIDPLWTPITVFGVRSRVQGWHTSPTNGGGQVQWQDLWVK